MSTIHRSNVGTYHPNPREDVAWTINDTKGYIDETPICNACDAGDPSSVIDMSVAFVCLDGGDVLCPDCAKKEGLVIVTCDCDEVEA